MKSHFLLPLLALAPIAASAQTKPKTAPQISIDPAAKALTDRAMATYKNAVGLRFRVASTMDESNLGTEIVSFSRPGLLKINGSSPDNPLKFLLDGKNYYSVRFAAYRKQPASAMAASSLFGMSGSDSGPFIADMLQGKNPIESCNNSYLKSDSASTPTKGFNSTTVAVAPRLTDGELLSGTQTTLTYDYPDDNGSISKINTRITAWFGGSPLMLRRTEMRYMSNGEPGFTMTDRIFDQQLNPKFAPDTFKFNATGLKPAVMDASGAQTYWDDRLVVGAKPFAFQTKAIDGKTISPANYKGKVLLMDFWATWCGPCVAGLPEIQAVYKKYHAQGVEVVGISLDGQKSDLTTFITARKMKWPQVLDSKDQAVRVPKLYGVQAIPFLLIIGKDGKIAAVNPRGKIDAAVKAALAAK
jgi:peroxiredoxin/outer membrane lipoprotein-sorting protein